MPISPQLFIAQSIARGNLSDGAKPWPGRQNLLKLCSMFALLLVLIVTQQLALTHGYTHFGLHSGASFGGQVAAHSNQDQLPDKAHTACALCVVCGGLHLASPPPVSTLAVVSATAQTLLGTVSPAPTFSFPAAYHSRAPPAPLD